MLQESMIWACLAYFVECQNKTIRTGFSLNMDILIAQIDVVCLAEGRKSNRRPSLVDRLMASLKKIIFLLQQVWLVLEWCVVFFPVPSKFPGGRRYLCTTMPWTIWPALVVLWGVCWMFYPSPTGGELALKNLDRLLDKSNQEESAAFACWLVQCDSNMFSDMKKISKTPNPGALDSPQPQYPPETESSDQSKAPSTLEGLGSLESHPTPPDASIPTIGSESGTNTTSDGVSSIHCPACGKAFSRRDVCTRHQKESCKKNRGRQSDHFIHLCPYPTCKRSESGHGFKRRAHLQQHLNHCDSHRQKLAESTESRMQHRDSISGGLGRERQANHNMSSDEVDGFKGESEGSDTGRKNPQKSKLEGMRRDLARELEKSEEESRRKRKRLEGLDARIRSLEREILDLSNGTE
ncbi:hypothetical protein BKA56DRAFT_138277 [Ilyonectria sp. MPI-CAGE-AT-0026]|nr:hypothetical protein BKA56DRAFT_138277 [Ilyonectria sp. MPI-CAGE-AT-0026]